MRSISSCCFLYYGFLHALYPSNTLRGNKKIWRFDGGFQNTVRVQWTWTCVALAGSCSCTSTAICISSVPCNVTSIGLTRRGLWMDGWTRKCRMRALSMLSLAVLHCAWAHFNFNHVFNFFYRQQVWNEIICEWCSSCMCLTSNPKHTSLMWHQTALNCSRYNVVAQQKAACPVIIGILNVMNMADA